MASMMTKKCKCCGKAITVRKADHDRGWGKFCSKSCKAKEQESRTGQYAHYIHEQDMANCERGWDAHKDIF